MAGPGPLGRAREMVEAETASERNLNKAAPSQAQIKSESESDSDGSTTAADSDSPSRPGMRPGLGRVGLAGFGVLPGRPGGPGSDARRSALESY